MIFRPPSCGAEAAWISQQTRRTEPEARTLFNPGRTGYSAVKKTQTAGGCPHLQSP